MAAATEAEILAGRDLVPPSSLVLDDQGSRDERKATQARLQAHPALQGVPLLILAYDTDIDSYTGAITKGAAAYLVKPVGPDELADRRPAALGLEAPRRPHGEAAARAPAPAHEGRRRPAARKVRVPGQLLDASGSGCRVELEEEVAAGELVRIILHGHEDSTHVALGAEVRWHASLPAAPTCVGCASRARRRCWPASCWASRRPD